MLSYSNTNSIFQEWKLSPLYTIGVAGNDADKQDLILQRYLLNYVLKLEAPWHCCEIAHSGFQASRVSVASFALAPSSPKCEGLRANQSLCDSLLGKVTHEAASQMSSPCCLCSPVHQAEAGQWATQGHAVRLQLLSLGKRTYPLTLQTGKGKSSHKTSVATDLERGLYFVWQFLYGVHCVKRTLRLCMPAFYSKRMWIVIRWHRARKISKLDLVNMIDAFCKKSLQLCIFLL